MELTKDVDPFIDAGSFKGRLQKPNSPSANSIRSMQTWVCSVFPNAVKCATPTAVRGKTDNQHLDGAPPFPNLGG